MADSDSEAGNPLLPCESQLPLTLQGIRPYATDPFWVRIRTAILFSLFVLLVAMLAAATVGATNAPSCSSRVKRAAVDGPVYRVETGAFYDESGSGKGDLKGLIVKLDYLSGLGVKVLWLSPIYKSPNKDIGYGIEDFSEVDEDFGTLDDFKKLLFELKKRGMKLVLDLVPNHTSDKHLWFQKSVRSIDPFTSYYVWEAPSKYNSKGEPVPPNNWVSIFGGSAWEFHEERKEYYLHQFSREQPDLNFRNENVLNEMMDIVKFWLDLGVDGFSLDAIPHLFEDSQLRNEPLRDGPIALNDQTSYDSFNHIYTRGLPEDMDVLRAFRDCIEDYTKDSNAEPKILMTRVYDGVQETMKYYGNSSKPLADFPFNFLLNSHLNSTSSAPDVMHVISLWLNSMPRGMTANWVVGNYNQERVADRLGPEMVDGMHMIALLLPGTAITYYGEEIGMEDVPTSKNNSKYASILRSDGINSGRPMDIVRTPMQWTNGKNAGFSSSNLTWLPVNNNYEKINVEFQEEGKSHLNVYKELVKARDSPAIKFGHLEIRVLNDSVFAFTRHEPGSPAYLVAVNWSKEAVEVDFGVFESMSDKARIYSQSIHSSRKDSVINDVHSVIMEPREGLVLIYYPKNS